MVSLKRWPEVERWLLAALEHDEATRSGFIDTTCPEDLRGLIRRLIQDLDEAALDEVLPLQPEWLSGASTLREQEVDTSMDGQIGAYRLLERIGRGGMGEVYMVRRERPGFPDPAALKVLRPDLAGSDAQLRFRRERVILAALDVPHVARLLDAGTTTDGRPYYVMEYVAGESVTDYVRRHDLSLPQRLRLFEKICEAVAHVHQCLIIHRDLKPANIFVCTSGGHPAVKLLDFGIATIYLPESRHEHAAVSMLSLTQKGTAPFTSAYAAPEQFRGSTVTPAADLYALGILLYEIVTDRHPRQKSPPQMQRENTSPGDASASPPAAAMPPYHPAWCETLHDLYCQITHEHPMRRFLSAEQLGNHVQKYRQQLEQQTD